MIAPTISPIAHEMSAVLIATNDVNQTAVKREFGSAAMRSRTRVTDGDFAMASPAINITESVAMNGRSVQTPSYQASNAPFGAINQSRARRRTS